MPQIPPWVKQLKPAGTTGSELLEKERAKSELPVDKLTLFLFGEEYIETRQKILKILMSEKIFDKKDNYFAGRVSRFETSLARAKRLRQLAVEHEWSLEDHNMAVELVNEPIPYMLHGTMFLLTLFNQSSDKQGNKYFMKAMNYDIIGCYAQTELGHGSNVRGLETTATWNPDDKTFTIHSPSLTASKWWIGSLGRTANHAVVMAQLVVNGEHHGPHPFLVQIRDLETHQPLEGIHVGDVGPKVGYNTMDNGFMLFNNVKVPHESMLARHSRVDAKTNTYIKPKSAALVYGTMTWVRSTIVWQAGGVLARGVSIAIRYCAVRRQFQDRDAAAGEGETQVLDYSMVSFRLLTLLAATFALHFSGKTMMDMYQAGQGELGDDQSEAKREEALAMMADLHATSCGLKSLASTTAADGLEQARRACGGHGYSSFSGIGAISADYLPNVTWEGDNYMLTQQVGQYLLKTARTVKAGFTATNDTAQIYHYFYSRADIGCAFDILGNDLDIVQAFAWRSANMAFDLLKSRDELKMPWNDLLVPIYRLSKAHSQYMIVRNFYDTLNSEETKKQLDEPTLELMWKLFRLYALTTLEAEASEFYTSAAVTVKQILLARGTAVPNLLKDIRPHAVKLVDSWAFPDWQLDSSLGRYDGNVYEDMFRRASEDNPLNEITVDPYPNNATIFKSTGSLKSKL